MVIACPLANGWLVLRMSCPAAEPDFARLLDVGCGPGVAVDHERGHSRQRNTGSGVQGQAVLLLVRGSAAALHEDAVEVSGHVWFWFSP